MCVSQSHSRQFIACSIVCLYHRRHHHHCTHSFILRFFSLLSLSPHRFFRLFISLHFVPLFVVLLNVVIVGLSNIGSVSSSSSSSQFLINSLSQCSLTQSVSISAATICVSVAGLLFVSFLVLLRSALFNGQQSKELKQWNSQLYGHHTHMMTINTKQQELMELRLSPSNCLLVTLWPVMMRAIVVVVVVNQFIQQQHPI